MEGAPAPNTIPKAAIPEPRIFEEDHPISKLISIEAHQGKIRTLTTTPFDYFSGTSAGVFSFVYYFKESRSMAKPEDFLKTLWYRGLKIYLDFVHNPTGTLARGEAQRKALFDPFKTPEMRAKLEFPDIPGGIGSDPIYGKDNERMFEKAQATPPLEEAEANRFVNWSVVIYTDRSTQALLRTVFPFSEYPRLCIAVVLWPYYSLEGGICEYSILRCMRFQATELFPNSTICIRDADTIFVNPLGFYDKLGDYITYLVMWWECEFLKSWSSENNRMEFDRKNISADAIIGTMTNYVAEWHKNFPGELAIAESTYFRGTLATENGKSAVFNNAKGLFAGFVNVGRGVYSKSMLWSSCVSYLVKRYFIAMSGGKRVISDQFCRSTTGIYIGKDERLLIFVFPQILYRIEYYFIEYSSTARIADKFINSDSWPLDVNTYSSGKNGIIFEHLLTPYYPVGVLNTCGKTINEVLKDTYQVIREEYNKFLAEVDVEKEMPSITKQLQTCNPGVAAEDLFLKRAEFVSPDALGAALSAPTTTRNNLKRAAGVSGGRRGRTQKRVKAQRRGTRKA